jgi:hypothetical protein
MRCNLPFLQRITTPEDPKEPVDPRSGIHLRHHLHESVLQKWVKAEAKKAGLHQPAGCHFLGKGGKRGQVLPYNIFTSCVVQMLYYKT